MSRSIHSLVSKKTINREVLVNGRLSNPDNRYLASQGVAISNASSTSFSGVIEFAKQTRSTLGATITGTGTFTLALPLNNMYFITAAAAITITLPTNGPQYAGSRITFRRTVGSGIVTFNQTGGASVFMPAASITVATSANMSATQRSTEFISDGTYWCQLYAI